MALINLSKECKKLGLQSLKAGTLDKQELPKLVKQSLKGKFADATVRRMAEIVVEELSSLKSDVLYCQTNLTLDGDVSLFQPPGVALLIVNGNLNVSGTYESAMDPSSVVVVTGDLEATNIINGGALEVHGSVRAKNAAIFHDNDPCSEIMGDLEAPFLYTQYHSAKIHGALTAKLYTGDDDTLESKKTKRKNRGFLEETGLSVKPKLSAALLKALAEDIFDDVDEDDEDATWIDYIDLEKLIAFVRAGGNPLSK